MILFEGAEWDFSKIEKTWEVIDRIGKQDFGLSYYEPQIEIINAEQMLDAYSSVAMPIMYNHWSFGKSFIQNANQYQHGQMGLAYEVVINTNPTLTYLMEENTMTMQALVMAHAVVGHGSFFKNNYMFKGWTDAESILDYLQFAKNFVKDCEERYGSSKVEQTLDACHALQDFGCDKYKRPISLSKELKRQKTEELSNYFQSIKNDLYDTTAREYYNLQKRRVEKTIDRLGNKDREFPEENLLYFLEKKSPILKDWQRELVRIVRKVSQYFYPQSQTQLMNEGWACFWHYHVMEQLYEQGYIDEGSYLEFLQNHTAVTRQADYTSRYYHGLNVYALGFAMMMDIKRICVNPTEEDKYWSPDICNTDWKTTLKYVMENYRDESFILQYLSPTVIRKFKFFAIQNDANNEAYITVTHVSRDEDVLNIRKILAQQYSRSYRVPQIEIVNVNWTKDRNMTLYYYPINGKLLDIVTTKETLDYIRHLWGFSVSVEYLDRVNSTAHKVNTA